MLLWSIIVLLLVLTLSAILWPLFRGRDTLETREAFDANVYKDQLKIIDRELDEGQIDPEEANAARIEISRKLLEASDLADKHPSMKAEGRQLSHFAAIGLGLTIPLFAVGLYLQVGSPALPDLPLEARAKMVPGQGKIAELIARAEQRLKQKPEDGRGWEIMAPIYVRHQMYGKAVAAYQNALRLLGSSVARLSGLADAMVLLNDGIVGDDVVPILKRAIKADTNHPKPHFWLGLYHEQNSQFKQADEVYTNLLKKSGAQADWRPMVEGRLDEVRKKQGLPPVKIAGIQAKPKPEIKLGDALKSSEKKADKPAKSADAAPSIGPTAEDVKRAGQMSADDRQSMINNMVSGLAERLNEEGGDIASWIRLVSAYNVLGKKAEAHKTVQAAKKNLENDKQAVAELDALAKRLGLGS